MGYRSDVTFVFYTCKPEVIPLSILKLWFDENYPKHDFGEVEVGDNYILVRYEGVKWYTSYPEVQAVDRAVEIFTAAFQANDKDDVAWEYAQVGEELNDTDHGGSSYHHFRLGINRTIYFN